MEDVGQTLIQTTVTKLKELVVVLAAQYLVYTIIEIYRFYQVRLGLLVKEAFGDIWDFFAPSTNANLAKVECETTACEEILKETRLETANDEDELDSLPLSGKDDSSSILALDITKDDGTTTVVTYDFSQTCPRTADDKNKKKRKKKKRKSTKMKERPQPLNTKIYTPKSEEEAGERKADNACVDEAFRCNLSIDINKGRSELSTVAPAAEAFGDKAAAMSSETKNSTRLPLDRTYLDDDDTLKSDSSFEEVVKTGDNSSILFTNDHNKTINPGVTEAKGKGRPCLASSIASAKARLNALNIAESVRMEGDSAEVLSLLKAVKENNSYTYKLKRRLISMAEKMVNRATARHAKLEEITLEVSALSKQEECDCTVCLEKQEASATEEFSLLWDNLANNQVENSELTNSHNSQINRAEDVNLLSDNDFDNDHAHNKELMGGDNPADIHAESIGLMDSLNNNHSESVSLTGESYPTGIHAKSVGFMDDDEVENDHAKSVSLAVDDDLDFGFSENIALVAENDSDYIHGENVCLIGGQNLDNDHAERVDLTSDENHAESMGLNDDVNFGNDHMKRMSQTGDYNLGDDHSETAGSMGDDNSANVYADALILDNNYEEGVDLRGNDDFEKDHAENMDFMGDDVPEINHVEHVDLMVDAGINYVMGNAVSPKLSKLPTLAQLPFGVMGIEMAKRLSFGGASELSQLFGLDFPLESLPSTTASSDCDDATS